MPSQTPFRRRKGGFLQAQHGPQPHGQPLPLAPERRHLAGPGGEAQRHGLVDRHPGPCRQEIVGVDLAGESGVDPPHGWRRPAPGGVGDHKPPFSSETVAQNLIEDPAGHPADPVPAGEAKGKERSEDNGRQEAGIDDGHDLSSRPRLPSPALPSSRESGQSLDPRPRPSTAEGPPEGEIRESRAGYGGRRRAICPNAPSFVVGRDLGRWAVLVMKGSWRA